MNRRNYFEKDVDLLVLEELARNPNIHLRANQVSINTGLNVQTVCVQSMPYLISNEYVTADMRSRGRKYQITEKGLDLLALNEIVATDMKTKFYRRNRERIDEAIQKQLSKMEGGIPDYEGAKELLEPAFNGKSSTVLRTLEEIFKISAYDPPIAVDAGLTREQRTAITGSQKVNVLQAHRVIPKIVNTRPVNYWTFRNMIRSQ